MGQTRRFQGLPCGVKALPLAREEVFHLVAPTGLWP
jgi:hypothetical protein